MADVEEPRLRLQCSECGEWDGHFGSCSRKSTFRRAEVVVPRTTTNIDNDVFSAFNRAYNKFVRDFGRVPNWNVTTFQGGFTDETVTFELIEEVQ